MVALVAVLAAGCDAAAGDTDGPPGTAAPTGVTAAPTTADPEQAARAEVLETYRAWWGDLIAANRDPVTGYERLDDHMTGDALKTLQVFIIDRRHQGLETRGQVEIGAPEISVKGRQATATGCVDATRSVTYRGGKRLANSAGSIKSYTVRFASSSGGWKVTNFSSKESKCVVTQSLPP
jgi:hypothetical protein